MKLFAGWAIPAGLLLAASAAQAQIIAPEDGAASSHYQDAADFDGPYSAVPPAPAPYAYEPAPSYGPPPGYGPTPGPTLLPVPEVYAVLRENGFSPRGVPYLRGYVYTIAATDPDGEDGRLAIDGRTGRIIRFMPAYTMRRGFDEYRPLSYGPQSALPLSSYVVRVEWPLRRANRHVPRPPASIPHVAGRPVPLPAPRPAAAVERANPAGQMAAIHGQPVPKARQTAGTVDEHERSTAVIRPTQPMPPVQGLD